MVTTKAPLVPMQILQINSQKNRLLVLTLIIILQCSIVGLIIRQLIKREAIINRNVDVFFC